MHDTKDTALMDRPRRWNIFGRMVRRIGLVGTIAVFVALFVAAAALAVLLASANINGTVTVTQPTADLQFTTQSGLQGVATSAGFVTFDPVTGEVTGFVGGASDPADYSGTGFIEADGTLTVAYAGLWPGEGSRASAALKNNGSVALSNLAFAYPAGIGDFGSGETVEVFVVDMNTLARVDLAVATIASGASIGDTASGTPFAVVIRVTDAFAGTTVDLTGLAITGEAIHN